MKSVVPIIIGALSVAATIATIATGVYLGQVAAFKKINSLPNP